MGHLVEGINRLQYFRASSRTFCATNWFSKQSLGLPLATTPKMLAAWSRDN